MVMRRTKDNQLWSPSILFLVGTLALGIVLLSVRPFLHGVSVQNQSTNAARVTCGPFVNVVVNARNSESLMFSLWGTSMDCDVRVGGRPTHCSADLLPLSEGSVEILPNGDVECRNLN